MDCAKPLEASEIFRNLPEPRGGHFKSRTPENRAPEVSCTKNVNLMSLTPQVILVYAERLPRPIWLDSDVFKGPYAPFFLTLRAIFSVLTAYMIIEHF